MDIDIFSPGEQFSTFDSRSFLDPESSISLDDFSRHELYEWHLDSGKELDTDMGVQSIPNGYSHCNVDNILPKEDIQKIWNDFQQSIDIGLCDEFTISDPVVPLDVNEDETTKQESSLHSLLDIPSTSSFDITKYIDEEPSQPVSVRKPKAGVKRIDVKGQRYIVNEDEDEVDIETISESEESPVLEACDLNSLLEQFEATEKPHLQILDIAKEDGKENAETLRAAIKTEPPNKTQEQANANKVLPNHTKRSDSTTSLTPSTDLKINSQISAVLPQELIARIKESRKRKPISVIPPIPNKKRIGSRLQEQIVRSKTVTSVNPELALLDHDYCSIGSPYTYLKKDSGFESAKEETERTIIGQQPMVKNADGKLMVSLLKVNTIRKEVVQKKKILNLEEYKKRRKGFLKSHTNSLNSSPATSTCSSPLQEDENLRRLRHQEKLMRMAQEVLNTSPKTDRKPESVLVQKPVAPAQLPPNMEKKELVSIGVNTDFKISKDLDPLAPVERLEEIKPLLKKASAKINCNSLINSLIENIPKVIDSCQTLHDDTNTCRTEDREDKTIVYLPKNRTVVETRNAECQTKISLIRQIRGYKRRRKSSSSTTTSSSSENFKRNRQDNRRRRKNSCDSSRSSRSSLSWYSNSSYSPRCYSRSRSRSSSPKYSHKEREHLREVEERRVIYVGRISPRTTREELRERFLRFGPITNVSLHSRGHGDNYGFVTFANKLDAYEAIEHGNDDPYQPKYDLSFGGRRIFCKTSYSDLDNMREESIYFPPRMVEDSFDTLLKEMQEKLCKRKV